MRKILVIISGGLPIPAIKGGAVETLIDSYINENEKNPKYEFEVYSTYCENIEKYQQKYKNCSFSYIKVNSFLYQVDRYFRAFMHKIFKLPIEFKFIHEIKKDIKRNNKHYDLIIVENNASIVPPIAKLFKNRVVLHLHNDNVNNQIQDGYKIFNECRRIYAVSDYIKNRCLTCDSNSSKVITLFNGINQHELLNYKNTTLRNQVRSQYGINKNDIVFIFTGRVCDDKGVRELLIAFNKLCEKYNDIKLMIVGASFFSAKKKSKYVKELISIAKLNKKKIIFTGYVKHSEIGKIYNAADIQVVPSKFDDPCPLTVLEGITMGLPQIVSNCGGIPEEVNEKNAIFVDRKDLINNLKIAMAELIDNSRKRFIMSKNSFERAKLFTLENYNKNFFMLIDEEFDEEGVLNV